jgi:hypothetical protein
MEQVKMSDTFYLPLDFTDNGDKGGELIENGIPVFMRGCKCKAKYAAIAINSYDQHIELIKMLREALFEIANLPCEIINEAPLIACDALSATEQK